MTNTIATILVVEDAYDDREVVTRILHHQGFSTQHAVTGKEALLVIEQNLPDVVIMDLALPELDGWETLRMIRQNDATARIPVIATTAYYSLDVQQDIFNAGFDAYLPKPIHMGRLMDTLNELIN